MDGQKKLCRKHPVSPKNNNNNNKQTNSATKCDTLLQSILDLDLKQEVQQEARSLQLEAETQTWKRTPHCAQPLR